MYHNFSDRSYLRVPRAL